MKFKMIFLNCFITVWSFAQEGGSNVENVLKATVINPGVSYEKALGKNSTLYGQLSMDINGYFTYSDNFGTNSAIYLDPALTVQYRYYYNAARRRSKNKRTELNSMNYIAGLVKHVYSRQADPAFSSDDHYHQFYNKIGVVWGMQRNYNSRFSLDLNAGLGMAVANIQRTGFYGEKSVSTEVAAKVLGQVTLGFWLNKRG